MVGFLSLIPVSGNTLQGPLPVPPHPTVVAVPAARLLLLSCVFGICRWPPGRDAVAFGRLSQHRLAFQLMWNTC